MTTAHKDRTHARVSPSGAHKAIHCPGSVTLESLVAPSASSDAANEGTAAHEVASWCLLNDANAEVLTGKVVDIAAKNEAGRFLPMGSATSSTRWEVTPEMADAVQTYLDFVRSKVSEGCELAVEQRVDISHVHPDCWGTGDAIIYHPVKRHVWVIDLKYGRGVVVEARDNPQLLLYAAGAVRRFDNRGVDLVSMAIVQPRAAHQDGPIRPWVIDREELALSERALSGALARVDAAAMDYERLGPEVTYTLEDWTGQYTAAGDHCRWCEFGAQCQTRAAKALADCQAEFGVDGSVSLPAPVGLSPEALSEFLRRARQVQHWCNAVEEFANAEAQAGRVPPGFKLVPKRATRRWADEEHVRLALPLLTSLSEADLFGAPALLSPAQVEKKVKKAERDVFETFVTKSSSGTNLVPVEDARAPVRPSAADEFTPVSLS